MRQLLLSWLARLYRVGITLWWRVRKPTTVGVRGLVVDGEGRVLLVRHTYLKGWHLPGGGVKSRESIEEAVRRELREEVGVEVPAGDECLRLLGAYTNMHEVKRDHIAVFVAEQWTRSPHTGPRLEIAEERFFPADDLPDETTPATRRRIEEFSGKRRVSFLW